MTESILPIRHGWPLLLAVVLLTASPARAHSLPKHLGVASCASSTCHGRVTPAPHSDVALDEYFIWSKYDGHSKAYTVLKGPWGQRIGRNMGIGDPAKAAQCLDCHTDDVPPAQRGKLFRLSDGVGCEACHGGAQNWIASHAKPHTRHAANLKAGMQPTANPQFRARLCGSCHVGNGKRFVSHEMMAAGHPPLRFELDTWTVNLPPHWNIDADYRKRKPVTAHADRWAAGIVTQSIQYLKLLGNHINTTSLFPDPALFSCKACHQLMDTNVTRSPAQRRVAPAGTVLPADHDVLMLITLTALRDKSLARRIRAQDLGLNAAAAKNTRDFRHAAHALLGTVERVKGMFAGHPLSAHERTQLRRSLLQAAADERFRAYADAQQLYFALQALAAHNASRPAQHYKTLFNLLNDPKNFDPRKVAAAADKLLAASR